MKSRNSLLKGLGVAAAVGLLLTFGFDASAQDTTKKAPAKKPSAAKSVKPASACKGLEEAACKAKAAECSWIGAAKTKAGTSVKAYCRAKPAKKT